MSGTKMKRRLRFAETIEVHPIIHIDDMEESDVQATWYQKTEYDAIKSKLIPIIRKMMKGEPVEESDKETTRGLEYRTRKGALRRQHNKIEGMTAVIEEQLRQRQTGCCNSRKISDAYKSATSHCQDAAHALGIEDENFIMKDLEETRRHPKELCKKPKSRGLNKLIKQVRRRNSPVSVKNVVVVTSAAS